MKPFIIIVGLFRSGTTLAQELLTQKDVSFIFHEPRFFEMGWQFQNYDKKYLAEKWGLTFPNKFLSTAEVWKYFMEDLGLQIGVKEIRNAATHAYYEAWGGNARLLVIDRDAVEIYKSCYKMFMRNNAQFHWRPMFQPLSPINVYREVKTELKNINNLWNMFHPLCKAVVNYHELINKNFHQRIYDFLESDITDPEIGEYHSILPRGQYETDLHKGKVTDRAIGLSETPNIIKDQARKFSNLLAGNKAWV
ncbi:MAG: sulfotransferase domain-containing protein [Actinomycetia bacterium]|nr:sulfotransferase domain-containing protein [Actinomycetes bacterium]